MCAVLLLAKILLQRNICYRFFHHTHDENFYHPCYYANNNKIYEYTFHLLSMDHERKSSDHTNSCYWYVTSCKVPSSITIGRPVHSTCACRVANSTSFHATNKWCLIILKNNMFAGPMSEKCWILLLEKGNRHTASRSLGRDLPRGAN